ncbi:DUF3237 family protein [Actinomadura litoris]|uniref:DUF3237 family protein n=1 Tax=Actinomadura litoris TaxID=2678616 RepID=UPI0012E1B129|nr:DUF3237 family protein [Actinomadura litoris]
MLTLKQIVHDLPGTSTPASHTPLFRGVWRPAPYATLGGTPAGTRVIIDLTDGIIEGRGLTARLQGAAADWFVIGPDGTGTLDWRGRVVTEDNALIYMYGTGRMNTSPGFGGKIVGACMFETGAERYRWLNRLQAVYRAGMTDQGTADALYHDEYFELR